MNAIIVDGKALAHAVLENLKPQIEALGQPVHLAAICVGDDPGLQAFVKLKQKAAQAAGILFSAYLFDGDDKAEVIQTLKYLAADDTVHGIFIELPLPKGWDANEFIALVPPHKDVDALTGKAQVLEPAVRALEYVFQEYDIVPSGMSVAVVGQGKLIGAPISRWLSEQGALVTPIDIHTQEPASMARQADMVIAGVGKPGLVTEEWVKEGAVVIDYGYGKSPDKKDTYAGDVEAKAVIKKAKLLTPVPGGMGPLVIAATLENCITLALNAKD